MGAGNREILKESGIRVFLADSNWSNVSAAKIEGLPAFCGNVLSKNIFEEIDLAGLGRMLALTQNDEVNNLATLHFRLHFDNKEVYQLTRNDPENSLKHEVSPDLRGRLLFGDDITFDYLTNRFKKGAVLKKTTLSEKFDYAAFQEHYGNRAIPMFLISADNRLTASRPTTSPISMTNTPSSVSSTTRNKKKAGP